MEGPTAPGGGSSKTTWTSEIARTGRGLTQHSISSLDGADADGVLRALAQRLAEPASRSGLAASPMGGCRPSPAETPALQDRTGTSRTSPPPPSLFPY